jgi:HSP20 family protein
MTRIFLHPVDGLETIERNFRNLLDTFPAARGWRDSLPLVDMYEDDVQLYADVELPGYRKEDVKITIHDGVLTLKGERKNSRAKEMLVNERSHGSFTRSFTLPVEVDVNRVEATYADGVLNIRMPKSNPRDIERSIEIK